MEIILLFILMKYSRYTSHFIGLVHTNDLVVISAWWSRPMHICMLQVSRLWWYAKFACYSCCIEITLIGAVWISFLPISAEFNFSRNVRLIHCTWNLHWNSNLQLGSRTRTWTHTFICRDCQVFTTAKPLLNNVLYHTVIQR